MIILSILEGLMNEGFYLQEITFSKNLLNEMTNLYKESIPCETGGILLGRYSIEKKSLHIEQAIEIISKSKSPTHYIRNPKKHKRLLILHGMKLKGLLITLENGIRIPI